MPNLALLVSLLQLAAEDRTQLAHENIALRHQFAVYKRSVQRPSINDSDRIFGLTVMRMLKEWRNALVFVQPDAVVRWHRARGQGHFDARARRSSPPLLASCVAATRPRLHLLDGGDVCADFPSRLVGVC
jgi:hypothetical protein